MSTWDKIRETAQSEITKLLIVGGLTFALSALYTNWKTAPGHNITIVPREIEYEEQCSVNTENLQKVIDSNRSSLDSYKGIGDPYLDALITLKELKELPGPKSTVVYKRDFQNVLDEVESRDRIRDCQPQDEHQQRRWDDFTIIKVQTVLFIDEPGWYALDPLCTLVFEDGLDEPARISMRVVREPEAQERDPPIASGISVRGISPYQQSGVRESLAPIPVSGSRVVWLEFNPGSPRVEARRSEVGDIVERINQHRDYKLGVECKVIRKSGSIKIGPNTHSFNGPSPIESPIEHHGWSLALPFTQG